MLAGKGIIRTGYRYKEGKGILRADYGSKQFSVPPHPLTNFEIQIYYQNEARFNGIFSRDKLPNEKKDGVYVKNIDEHGDTGTHWIAFFCTKTEVIYFDSFRVQHVPK